MSTTKDIQPLDKQELEKRASNVIVSQLLDKINEIIGVINEQSKLELINEQSKKRVVKKKTKE
jgi:hypothetical protein